MGRSASKTTPIAAFSLGILAVAALGLCAGPVLAMKNRPDPELRLSAMSFNIRFGTAPDGDNHWDKRKQLVFGTIRDAKMDVVGLQEALSSQIDEITAALPEFAVVGVGRDDAKNAGEFSAILVRSSRFRVAESGTFWLSDTPEVVASRTWGNTIPRICTWARLVSKEGRSFTVYNMHWDHASENARVKSGGLVAQRIAARSPKDPFLVMGDLNTGEDTPGVKALAQPLKLRDTLRVLYPDQAEVGTFTGFQFGETKGPKIDYVFVSPEWEVEAATIHNEDFNGRYASDHFAVSATVVVKP